MLARAYADVTHAVACGDISATDAVKLFHALREEREHIEAHKGTEVPELSGFSSEDLRALRAQIRDRRDTVAKSLRAQISEILVQRVSI